MFLTALIFSALAHAQPPIAGAPNAPILIEEYADFECPFCVRGAALVKRALTEYPGKVKFVFRNMPLVQIHPHSLIAAEAFTAIELQSPQLAYRYQQELFKNQDQLESKGETYLEDLAQTLGADVNRMRHDMNGPEVAKIIADDEKAGRDHGFQGTPSFVIGKETMTGAYPWAQFKKLIDKQI